ncbi:hypothetical protein AWB81_04678 [Caballeronia arationis]|jgi:hypothetical protein|nr:hypothetical protein [Caballeronia arationis]SAK88687.1 hypothetical protein AWB81_04678 [Caballeronia arationis]
MTLSGDSELARKLLLEKVKTGRRLYFRTDAIARLIDLAQS